MGGRFSSWQDNFREKIRLGEEEGGMASAQKVFLVGRSGIREGKCETMIFPLQQSKERLAKGGWERNSFTVRVAVQRAVGWEKTETKEDGVGKRRRFFFLLRGAEMWLACKRGRGTLSHHITYTTKPRFLPSICPPRPGPT